MLKTISLSSIFLFALLFAYSCRRNNTGDNSSNKQQTTSSANRAISDTIKANLAANDKNVQILEDGTVMLSTNGIVENLENTRKYSTFLSLLEKSGLYKALSQKGPFTVFVPSNEALEKIDKISMGKLMTPSGRPELEKIVKYHIIAGFLRVCDLTAGESISTIEGDQLVVIIENHKTRLMDGNGNMVDITRPDILSKNGIMHLTSGVLMPKGISLF